MHYLVNCIIGCRVRFKHPELYPAAVEQNLLGIPPPWLPWRRTSVTSARRRSWLAMSSSTWHVLTSSMSSASRHICGGQARPPGFRKTQLQNISGQTKHSCSARSAALKMTSALSRRRIHLVRMSLQYGKGGLVITSRNCTRIFTLWMKKKQGKCI